MKKILTAALTAGCAMALSAPAQAAVSINDTNFDFAAIDGNSLEFAIGYAEVGLANPVDLFLDFTNDLSGLYSFSFTTSSASVNIAQALVSGGGLLGPLSLVKTVDDGTTEQWALSDYGLDAGTYRLTILGEASGVGNSLTGTVNFAAVPEPATWALMILGFALVGGALRRRDREQRVRFNFA
ncbi:MAG: FxDxF family PEP-CTERM protein [Altererythrobacter sp.]|nr:FxDxF family PEP-CTERM protein [Altererythrobacter sp.]OJU59617.1 MAG: hypothetical protein BGO08_01215 [Altererythrobacter sp. 66-12]